MSMTSSKAPSHLRRGRSLAAVVGTMWNFATVGLTTLVTALVFVVTSRVLAPEDFGAVALAVAIVMMVGTLMPTAFGEALIQRADLRRDHLDSVFWLALGAGALGFGALVAAAPLVARLSGIPILESILPVLALRLLFEAGATVPNALIARRMNFRALALRSAMASILGGAICLVMVARGHALWALVASQVVNIFVSMVVAMVVARWRPGLMIHPRGLKELSHFGLYAIGGRAVNDARIDQFLLGAVLGPAALGLYYFARRIHQLLMDLTANAIMPVSSVLFASLQGEHAIRREAYLAASLGATAVATPMFAGCLAVAPTAVPLLFGPQWTPAVFALQCFAILGMMSGLGVIQAALIRNNGAPGWWFWYQAAGQAVSWGLILALAPFGINAVMAALVLRTLLMWPLSVRKVQQMLGLDLSTYAATLAGPMLGSLAMVPVVMSIPRFWPGGPWQTLAAQIAAGVLVYAVVLLIIAHRRLRRIGGMVLAARRARA